MVRDASPKSQPTWVMLLTMRPELARCLQLRQQLQLPTDRDVLRGLVLSDDEVERIALALPLTRDQWRLGHVLHRAAAPAHRPDDRVVLRRLDRIEDRLRIAEIARALEHVDRDLEQRMLEADRLRPRPLRRARIGVGQFARALAGEPRLERMVWRPPDLGREPVAAGAERVDDGREEQRLADGDDLRPETLLRRLRPEGCEVGR